MSNWNPELLEIVVYYNESVIFVVISNIPNGNNNSTLTNVTAEVYSNWPWGDKHAQSDDGWQVDIKPTSLCVSNHTFQQ